MSQREDNTCGVERVKVWVEHTGNTSKALVKDVWLYYEMVNGVSQRVLGVEVNDQIF